MNVFGLAELLFDDVKGHRAYTKLLHRTRARTTNTHICASDGGNATTLHPLSVTFDIHSTLFIAHNRI